MKNDKFFMHLALEGRENVFEEDKVPAGACIVQDRVIVALGITEGNT